MLKYGMWKTLEEFARSAQIASQPGKTRVESSGEKTYAQHLDRSRSLDDGIPQVRELLITT